MFGGDGIVTSIYHYFVLPALKFSRRIYRKYLRGVFAYLGLILAAFLGYELFYRRRLHKRIEAFCCKKQSSGQNSARAEAMRNLAREERIRHI